MLRIYKLYVGLSSNQHSKDIDREQVIQFVSDRIDSFTIYDAIGYFRKDQENTLVLSIAHINRNEINALTQDLCDFLHQEAIGLEYDGGYYRIMRRLPTRSNYEYSRLNTVFDNKNIGVSS